MTKPEKKEVRSRGSITERGKDTFLVRVYLGEDANGKRLYKNETVKGKRSEANERLTKLLYETDTGQIVQVAKTTVAEYLKDWLETTAKARVTEQTFYNYSNLVKNHIAPRIGKIKLTSLRRIDVQRFYEKMTVENIGGRTIQHCHSVLHAALVDAVRLNILAVNPAADAKLPKYTRKEVTVLNAEQAKTFLAWAEQTPHSCLFHFALETGARREEYLGLQWSDIDFQRRTVSIVRALKQGKRREGFSWYFGKLKTKRSRRTIPLTENLTRMLKTHRREQNERRLKLGAAYQNNDLIFASQVGTPLHPENLRRKCFKPLLTKAGLPDIRLYDLRHTCATLLLLVGVNPKVVSERLGHSTIVMTLDTYSHVLPQMQNAATNELERLLFSHKKAV